MSKGGTISASKTTCSDPTIDNICSHAQQIVLHNETLKTKFQSVQDNLKRLDNATSLKMIDKISGYTAALGRGFGTLSRNGAASKISTNLGLKMSPFGLTSVSNELNSLLAAFTDTESALPHIDGSFDSSNKSVQMSRISKVLATDVVSDRRC